MNPENPDHPELTAYALGELPPDQEHEMRAWIASDPNAMTELADIEHISDALHHGAPIPAVKLTPRQRQNVLTPPRGPRIITPMMPRQPVAARRQPRFSPFLASVTRIAAMLTVAAGAYYLGRHGGGQAPSSVVQADTPGVAPGDAATLPAVVQVAPSQSATAGKEMTVPGSGVQAVVAPAVKPELATTTPSVPAPPALSAAQKTPAMAVRASTKTAAAPVVTTSPPPPAKPAAAQPQPSPDLRGYAVVSREPTNKVTIRPYETRPVPVKMKDRVLASPLPVAVPAPPASNGKARQPELSIQSWKAEVATCPWNPSHRLMRVLLQLPADQAAATSPANSYPVQITFDNLAVRSYRLLSENHVPPQPGNNAAAHVMWYEVIPNGANSDAVRDNGRQVATITVPNARFNSQTVGPFDGSRLQVLDRGVKWENAREDFLFETSIVGFGLLLRGSENLGALDHELVLKIARQAGGEKEPGGERARFIKLVEEARRVTGI